MAHNIDTSTGRAAIAFQGSRNDIWHRLGQEAQPDWTAAQWAAAAGLDWQAVKVPALADLTNLTNLELKAGAFIHVPDFRKVEGDRYVVRSDNGHVLGHVSDRYQPVQPSEVLDWFQRYIKIDSRFRLDVAGALKQGEIIWATATYNGDIDVAGDKHTARLLMTTTFDGTGSTINRATMTRVVCNNTLDCALADKQKSLVRTRHSTRFDAAKVGAELATIAQGFASYRAMGEAMASHAMTAGDIGRCFKAILEIPFDAKPDEVSTRKKNQYSELSQAFTATRHERGESLGSGGTAWTALNAVTRYIDHERGTRNDNGNPHEARFVAAQFGSGAQMKAKAIQVLDEMCDGDLLKAVADATQAAKQDDVSGMLTQSFRSSRFS